MVTKGYGITIQEINWSCPADLEPYNLAHEKEIEEKDALNWQLGQYFSYALDSTVCNAILWRRKGEKAHSYISEPFSYRAIEAENESEKELQRQRELFMMKLKTIAANFEINKEREQHGAKTC